MIFCFLGGEACVYAWGGFLIVAVDSLWNSISTLKIYLNETVTDLACFATPYEVGFSFAPRDLVLFLVISALNQSW